MQGVDLFIARQVLGLRWLREPCTAPIVRCTRAGLARSVHRVSALLFLLIVGYAMVRAPT
jgi:hypothetical protein